MRDQRELLRLRIFLVHLRTRVKNRIHGTLARHNVQIQLLSATKEVLLQFFFRGNVPLFDDGHDDAAD